MTIFSKLPCYCHVFIIGWSQQTIRCIDDEDDNDDDDHESLPATDIKIAVESECTIISAATSFPRLIATKSSLINYLKIRTAPSVKSNPALWAVAAAITISNRDLSIRKIRKRCSLDSKFFSRNLQCGPSQI